MTLQLRSCRHSHQTRATFSPTYTSQINSFLKRSQPANLKCHLQTVKYLSPTQQVMEIAETSNPSATGSEKGSKNCGQAKKELATPAKQLFRPINFENGSPTPATPEGIDSNGSKVTLGNDSESGSENALDSAYSSDNPQPQNGKSAGKMVATLQNKTLWKDFRKIGNEMIVTKPGR